MMMMIITIVVQCQNINADDSTSNLALWNRARWPLAARSDDELSLEYSWALITRVFACLPA